MNTPFEQLNDADLELVSAYIDGEVTSEERAMLEARMEREPALRATFEELQATVQLVHELPRLAPPRSFTIDPARARPRRAGAFVWMRFGSALAAVLLALTVTFDLVGSRGSGMASMSAPAAIMSDQLAGGAASATPSVENAESAANSAANANSAAASQPAPTSAPASGASGATAATPPAKQPPSIMMQSAPAEQATETVQSTEGGPSNTLTLRSAAPQTEQAPADAQTQSAPAPTTAAAGVAESGNSAPGAQTFAQPAAQPIPPQEPFRPLRLIEFGLAALALALGLAALWVARRGRG